MKNFCLFLVLVLLAGCTGAHRKGISRYDEYDSTRVDQMVGNNVSGTVLEKTIVCLNARRESRHVIALTNVTVLAVTNATVNAVTNQTISVTTNYLVTTMTNLAPSTAPAPVPTAPEGAPPAESPTVAAATNATPSYTTNVSLSLAANNSAVTAPSQTAANTQVIRTYNNQITTASNNLTVSLMTNLVVTAETNAAVQWVTNYYVSSVTNVIITPTNFTAHDYFLYTELIPPPDFNLAPGESLILLVDGQRHGFSPGQSGTAFVARKGYTSNLYRVPPETLVAIANAKEVKVRFKGVNSVIERNMSAGSKQNFKSFLLKYFGPEPSGAPAKKQMASN